MDGRVWGTKACNAGGIKSIPVDELSSPVRAAIRRPHIPRRVDHVGSR